ncbi:hypothetical protein [Corynebacterium phocae]|uniref:hypothetical protein n=1 Tax=Corynebacterium phocae TaxID=161895 RepID=UPI00123A7011|nr:hypothetical protein [Corynebacterium phocae]KAA8728627.1 hypothetical protein F4V58_00020 [Corynebacterium phocae]
MKKFVPLFAALCLALTACSPGSNTDSEETTATNSSTKSQTSTPSSSKSPSSSPSTSASSKAETSVTTSPSAAAPVQPQQPQVPAQPIAPPAAQQQPITPPDILEPVRDLSGYNCPGTDAFVDDPAMCNPDYLGSDPGYEELFADELAELRRQAEEDKLQEGASPANGE